MEEGLFFLNIVLFDIFFHLVLTKQAGTAGITFRGEIMHIIVGTPAAFAKKEEFLILKIEAKDTVALRAALNAYLRWINSIFNVLGIIETR